MSKYVIGSLAFAVLFVLVLYGLTLNPQESQPAKPSLAPDAVTKEAPSESPVVIPEKESPAPVPKVEQPVPVKDVPAVPPVLDSVASQEPVTIFVYDFSFAPVNVTVKKGTTVVWKYAEGKNVHVVNINPLHAQSPLLKLGGTWNYTFERNGTFLFIDAVFPFMQGYVIVQ